MATTPKGYPYPVSTAPPNVPADLQALAQALDTQLPFRFWIGFGNVVLNNAAAGTVNVTFTAGRFTQVPRVLVTPISAGTYLATPQSITTSGFILNARHYKDTLATVTVTVAVLAIQMLTTSADG